MKTYMSGILILFSLLIGNTAEANQDALSHKEEIRALIQLYVANSLSSGPEEIHVRQVLPANGTNVTNGRSFQWSGKVIGIRPGSQGRLLGRALFVLSIKDNEGGTKTRWFTADVEKIERVVVTTRSLKRHHVLGPDDLTIKTLSVTRRRNRYIGHPETLIGKRLTRSTGKGLPIRTDRIEETPLIFRGDRVMLLLESRGLRIMTSGKAKEDGFLGKIIGIQNLDSRKVVYGRVIESGIVKVSFTTIR